MIGFVRMICNSFTQILLKNNALYISLFDLYNWSWKWNSGNAFYNHLLINELLQKWFHISSHLKSLTKTHKTVVYSWSFKCNWKQKQAPIPSKFSSILPYFSCFPQFYLVWRRATLLDHIVARPESVTVRLPLSQCYLLDYHDDDQS